MAKSPAKKTQRSGNNGSTTASKKSASSKSNGQESGTSGREDLNKLFEHSLKDMYWAEKALTKAIPKMIKNATSEELKSALEEHLTVTEGQVNKLEQVFESLEMAARGKKCPGIEGIITEGNELMEEFDSPAGDSAIIAAARKVEHYEISSYISMISLARTLQMTEQSELLSEILDEEREADAILEELAMSLTRELVEAE
jgi:ferritin-like metal-binding protein YciE